MILSRKYRDQRSLTVNGTLFERVSTFLEAELIDNGSNRREIQQRINTANQHSFGGKRVLKFKVCVS